ncbi:MAG TPA: hypothetical protein EYP58_02070 [bacterium (Candidatus Stahlbacteria)]|nr:hypothetical protein [Candidatus Stahlbacteria bacterium]
MIILLIGLFDSLPPIPDPFIFNIESLPVPAVQRIKGGLGLYAFLSNPIGGRLTHHSPYDYIDLSYREGDDWIPYTETRAEGSVSLPFKNLISNLMATYHYSRRVDTLSYLLSELTFTAMDRCIAQVRGGITYNRISDTTIGEYDLQGRLILNRIGIIPQISAGWTRSGFSDFWGVEAGVRFMPLMLQCEYKDYRPGFTVGLSRLISGVLVTIKAGRTREPLYVRDILRLPPLRFSRTVTTPKEKIHADLEIRTEPLSLGLAYRLWDSFPVPEDSTLLPTMSKSSDLNGYFSIRFQTVIDSILIRIQKSDHHFQPYLKNSILIAMMRHITATLGYEEYNHYKNLIPGIRLEIANLQICCDYYPSEFEIYPGIVQRRRVAIEASWQSSFR